MWSIFPSKIINCITFLYVYCATVNLLSKAKVQKILCDQLTVDMAGRRLFGSKTRIHLTFDCRLLLQNSGVQETRNCFDPEFPNTTWTGFLLMYLANSSVSPDLSSLWYFVCILYILSLATFLEFFFFCSS